MRFRLWITTWPDEGELAGPLERIDPQGPRFRDPKARAEWDFDASSWEEAERLVTEHLGYDPWPNDDDEESN